MAEKQIAAQNSSGERSKRDVKFFIRFLDDSFSQVYDLAEKINVGDYALILIDLPDDPKPASITYYWMEKIGVTKIFRYACLIRETEYQDYKWEGAIISWHKQFINEQVYEGFYGGIAGTISEIQAKLGTD